MKILGQNPLAGLNQDQRQKFHDLPESLFARALVALLHGAGLRAEFSRALHAPHASTLCLLFALSAHLVMDTRMGSGGLLSTVLYLESIL